MIHEVAGDILLTKAQAIAHGETGNWGGGLDWRDVHPLIVQHLGDSPIPIYIYTTYHQGQKASEPEA